jgi:hypothetical protein
MTHEAIVKDTVLELIFKQCTQKKFKNENNNIANNFLTVQDKNQSIKYYIF